ncbi:tetratricopeptide repeat protein [Clostridium perfringens]|nr:tetratricopeptide repeat protein [Clostridium perfringens]
MIKKIVVAVGLVFSLSFFVGCGNKSLVEQGKAAIKQGNYEEATAIFKAASKEDSKDKEEAESLYDLTYNYVISTKAYNEFKLDVALDSLKKVEENENEELMKDDINSLKEEISKDKSVLDDFYSSMEKVDDLENAGKISEARDLLNKSLKNISYLGENVKELIESGNSKLKNLDEKLDKEELGKEDNNKEEKTDSSENNKELANKALETVKNLGVVKKDQYLELKSDEIYDLGDGSYGFIVNKYYYPEGKPEPAFICQYLVDKESWKVKEVKEGINKELN